MSISILNRGASGGLTTSIFVKGLSETDTVTATKDGKTVNGKWFSAEESGRFEGGHPECIKSNADYLLYTYGTRNYKKAYAGDAYTCTIVVDGWLSSLLVSKTASAVSVYTDGDHSSGVMDYEFTVTFRGETWYVSASGAAFQATAPTTSNVIHFGTFASRDGAALAFLEYALPQPVSGFEVAPIKDLGTWTITATNGEDTITQEVLIEVIGLYEIEMVYTTWLYNEGDECEDVTGGWNAYAYCDVWYTGSGQGFHEAMPTFTKNADHMYLHANPSCAGSVFPANAVDLTPYTKLFWTGSQSTVVTSGHQLVITAEKKSKYTSLKRVSIWQNTYLEVDVSDINQPVFIGLQTAASYDDGYNVSAITKKVWLE